MNADSNTDITNKWLVLYGDYGGQVYLTFPISLISTAEGALEKIAQLLNELDDFAWACNDGLGASVRIFERQEGDTHVPGGMGGGKLQDGLWLHDTFVRGPRYEPPLADPTFWRRRAEELLGLPPSS